MNDKLETLKEPPVGLRAWVKRMRDVDNLIERSGQRRKRLNIVRDHVTNLLGFDMPNTRERVRFLNELLYNLDILKLLKIPKNKIV